MKIRLTQYSAKAKNRDPERRHFDEVMERIGGASRVGSSFWKGARLCPRETGLVLAGVKREGFLKGRVALDMGLVFHHALERYYEAIMNQQTVLDGYTGVKSFHEYCVAPTVAAERAAWESIQLFESEPGYEDIFTTVQRMLSSYFEFYRARDRFRVLGVEETYDLMGPGFEYSARLDTIVEDMEHGGLWILEHKSATSATEDLLGGYQMDMQTLGQVWLLKQQDLTGLPPFKGVLVNIATKGKVTELHRVPVCPSDDHLKMFERSMQQLNLTLNLWEDMGWPQHLGNCTGGGRYFSTCQFFDICHSFPLASVEQVAEAPPFGFTSDLLQETSS